MKKWTLRIKITFLVGLVLTLACLVLTANSIFSARSYYSVLVEEIAHTGRNTGDSGSQPVPPPGEIRIDDPVSPYHEATRQFSVQSLLVMAGVIMISVGLTYYLAGRLLKPLTILTESIRAIDQGQLHQRVKLPEATGEVRQLTLSFNGMMDRLEDSFDIQKNFSANAAHELKTPLAVLKTSLQVLEMDENPSVEDYREFTRAAKSSLNRLVGTVDALVSLTRGIEENECTVVEIQPLLELIAAELKDKAAAGGILINISGACKNVRGEPVLLYRLFFNVIENAVKYNRTGGRVEITLSQHSGRAVIKVADTGIGMTAGTASHVFEPFYRADRSRSQKIPGSGLGLSVVKAIVERCCGDIHLVSTEGVGTTVTVIL